MNAIVIESLPEVRRNPAEIRRESQVRTDFDDTEAIQQLGKDIKANGLLSPPIIDPTNLLLVGERRVLAMIAVGITDAPFKVYHGPLTDTSKLILRVGENLHRNALPAPAITRALIDLRRLNPTWGNRQVGAALSLTESSVTRYLCAASCTDAVQRAYLFGQITLTQTYEISQVDQARQAEMLSAALAGASRDQLAQARKRRPADGQPEERLARGKFHLPGGTVLSIAAPGQGLSIPGLIDALQSVLAELRAAEKHGISPRSVQAAMKDKAAPEKRQATA